MRTYICSILKNNYQLKEAQNGAEALYLIQRETIDLIVSDLMMPVMDGNELSRRVKANRLLPTSPFSCSLPSGLKPKKESAMK